MKRVTYKSILQDEKECFFCRMLYDMKVEYNLHKHHVYEGVANRPISEANGFYVYLSPHYHNCSSDGVHFNTKNELLLKILCQRKYEETHTREDFRKLIGRSYL